MGHKCCEPSRPASEHGSHSSRLPGPLELSRLVIAGLAIVIVWLGVLAPPVASIVALGALAFCGYPIYKEALLALFQLRMTMELSMSIALVAALAIGELFTSLVIVLFVLVAEELEHFTVQRGRRSISSLLDLLPKTASVKQGAQFVEVPIANLKPGTTVLVRPGARIVVDGVVTAGESFVNEATITGESFPVEKTPGKAVYAGTINQSGALEVTAEKIGADTAFGKIVEAVEGAERSRAVVQRLADKMAGYLVLFALAAAAITFFITRDVRETISVIIVAGACGIAAGTPLAILGSIGRAARRGTIIKGGLYLERLAAIDTVVFDKTGTLTHGTPHVMAIYPGDGETAQSVLAAAASAEARSEHPLAKAIMARASELGISPDEPQSFSYIPGRGITCDTAAGMLLVGNRAMMQDSKVNALPASSLRPEATSEVFVARDGKLLGWIHIADTVRPEARQAVQDLRQMGLRTLLLTGDAQPVAALVAHQLGIDEFAAELKPDEKQERIIELQWLGRKTAMIGDGINDAPALAEASVGVAIGSGTDVAVESANVVLIGNDLLRFVEAVRIARRCRRVIWFNFIGTLVVDMAGMILALLGMLNPFLAALIHVGSELGFILNSARLFPVFRDRK